MLVAEARGKADSAIENNEDYLTSAVFGHLRYLPPSLFWPTLLGKVRGVASGDAGLQQYLTAHGCDAAAYESLDVRFWHSHPTLGEPDLLLGFRHPQRRPLFILIEVKLWSQKSGRTKDDDQICRYFLCLEDASWIRDREHAVLPVLIYLTPHDSEAEIEQSLSFMESPAAARPRLFQLQWQDVLAAARESAPSATGWSRIILEEVADFLHRRQLEYFNGFRQLDLPLLNDGFGHFYGEHVGLFSGMRQLPGLPLIRIERGRWVQ